MGVLKLWNHLHPGPDSQSTFNLFPHRCPFSPQWVAPAGNCRHKWSHLAECLTAKSYQENNLNVQTLHGSVSLRAHLRHAHTHVQKCRCNNSAVFKSLAMNCPEMPWTENLVFWLLGLCLPAAKNISTHLCSMFVWQQRKPQGMWDRHKQGWSRPLPGPMQGRRASSRQD